MKHVITASILVGALALVGCEEKKAPTVGETTSGAMDSVKDAAKDAGHAVGDATEKAVDAVKETAKDAVEATEKAVEKTTEAVKDAGDAAKEAAEKAAAEAAKLKTSGVEAISTHIEGLTTQFDGLKKQAAALTGPGKLGADSLVANIEKQFSTLSTQFAELKSAPAEQFEKLSAGVKGTMGKLSEGLAALTKMIPQPK